MSWTCGEFQKWFEAFIVSADARAHCHRVAACRRIDCADDLAQEWYLSVRTTTDRIQSGAGTLPQWIIDESSALRYALRALHNDAIDLGRIRGRDRSFRSDTATHALDTVEPTSTLIDATSHVALAHVSLDRLQAELNAMLRAGTHSWQGCRTEVVFQIAMGLIEWARTMQSHILIDRSPVSDWDAAIYAALDRIMPEAGESVAAKPKRDAARRQFKRRYGAAARTLLEQLAVAHLDDQLIAT